MGKYVAIHCSDLRDGERFAIFPQELVAETAEDLNQGRWLPVDYYWCDKIVVPNPEFWCVVERDDAKHWPDCVTNHGGDECDMGPECGTPDPTPESQTYQRYERSVLDVVSNLHSFAVGSLMDDPAEMRAQFDWLYWRVSDEVWLPSKGCLFDRQVRQLAIVAIDECRDYLGWEVNRE